MTLEHSKGTRPVLVTVGAAVWLGIGALMAFSSALGLLAQGFLRSDSALQSQPSTMDLPGRRILSWVFDHFALLAGTQLLLAIAILFAAWQFLGLRSWARRFLEIVTWLGLAYVAIFGCFWLYTWTSMTSPPSSSPSDTAFSTIGIVMGVAVLLFWAAPAVGLIWLLRHATVRAAAVR